MKKRFNTFLDIKYYVLLGIASLAFIALYIIDDAMDGIGIVLLKASKTIIEIFAFGMLPAVLLAWLTDIANVKKHNDNYSKYVITMDKTDYSRNGIVHINIIDFLLGNANI